jgi:hypothetical protein
MRLRLAALWWTLVLGLPAGEPLHPTLEGKVVAGYQGWFRAQGDGSGLGWVHFGPGQRLAPGACGIDLWPDLAEFPPEERFASPFAFADGKPADLFSSVHPGTVRRHFRWMRDYGIDGAMHQRFAVGLGAGRGGAALDLVLRNCTEAANAEGRSLTVMYDLTGLRPERFGKVAEDWRKLVAAGQTRQPCTQFHAGKPLVAVWGLGFSDRPAALAEWRTLLSELKASGAAVMVGVPSYWREGVADAWADPEVRAVIRLADVVSPWSVGRYARGNEVANYARKVWQPDVAACAATGQAYLPVVFPGFSWHNLSALRGQSAKLDQVPRRGGRLLWEQVVAARAAGARMLYVAMFDELDEGTAIMKCGGARPVGASPFVDLTDVPTDHYLWLAGQAGRVLRGELTPGPDLPRR